mgnify:CR=1 FL=1
MLLSSLEIRNKALSMRCFLSFLALFSVCVTSGLAEGGRLPLFEKNKQAIERTAKMYLAFEARHEIGPGTSSDLNLPEKAKFHDKAGNSLEWIYPVALGLEIKVGEEQRRIVVLAPEKSGGRYLVVTDDLVVRSYSIEEIQRVLVAIEKRKEKLIKSPVG